MTPMSSHADATDLSEQISCRQITCEEVMRAYLDRIARLNPAVNAIVSLQPEDELLAQARNADMELSRGDRRGWMHGFPIAIKDLSATAGIRTTYGSPLHATNMPAEDGLMVERIREAGAIIIGKTNTPEFGLGSHTYNPIFGITRNAYDPNLSAGGSSGGAAVALALDMVPIADGSDMMGSLRNPAGWNNVFGFRPSFGRVPSAPSPDVFLHQLSTNGPMAKTARDLARFLDVIAGYAPEAPLSLATEPTSFAGGLDRDVKDLRIGWIGSWGGYYPTEHGVLELTRAGLGALADQGATVEDLTPEFEANRLWDAWLVLRQWAVSQRLQPVLVSDGSIELLKPEARWELEQGLRLTAGDVHRASVTRSDWVRYLQKLFSQFDVLALPTAQIFAFPAELTWPSSINDRPMDTYHRWMEIVVPGSLSSHPVAAVPAGFDGSGRAMGIQLLGRARADRELLQIVSCFERNAPWVRQAPALLAHASL
ncbi:amidase [Sinorhizobium chiapasense]|uniref:Amidase n=1 Tax=Sinorhizobium chiapasense TaxID=501572 RepID=A0ABZ2BIW7_9HYPH